MFDLIIKDGIIIDGTKKSRYIADIGIVDGKINKIGNLKSETAIKNIDAKEKYIVPGFIDPHSHMDLNLPIWPENEAYVMQGVTTAISGNCGMSPAPQKKLRMFGGWEYGLSFESNPKYYTEVNFFDNVDNIKELIKKNYNCDLDYETLPEFFDKMEKEGFSVNYYPFVGHCNLRLAVMGDNFLRKATYEEINNMKALLREYMKNGARGLSTGLDYPPGAYASTEEIIELVKVVKEFNGIYTTHFRTMMYYVDRSSGMNTLYGIDEAIRIGKETDVKVHLSHMTPAFDIASDDDYEKIIEASTLVKEKINAAINDGVKITYDVIPNTSGGGYISPNFASLLRPWLLTAGSIEQLVKNLSVPDYLEVVKSEMMEGKYQFISKKLMPNLDDMYFIVKCTVEKYNQKTIRQIMKEMSSDDFEQTVIDIFLADPFTKVKFSVGLVEEFVRDILDHPFAMPSSDGFSYNQDANIGLDYPLNKFPHPNNFCYAVRYILEYGKDNLENAIYKMTGLPAEIFNINNRGIIKENNFADLVIFDLNSLKTNESYIDSRNFPNGIECVIINGIVTGENKKHTGAKAGKILR